MSTTEIETTHTMTECCHARTWRNRCTSCGHRQPAGGIPPIETRRLAWYGLRPWVAITELAGRHRARSFYAT